MENNQNPNLNKKEKKERHKLAYKISKEIVEYLKYPDIEERDFNGPTDKKDYVYKYDKDGHIEIRVEIWVSIIGYIDISFYLTNVVNNAIWLFQCMVSEEKFPEIIKSDVVNELKKRNINVLTLFDLEESEVPKFIETHAKKLVVMFLVNLRDFAESLVMDALGHSKIGYYMHFIKPSLKEHWKQLGLPADFDLITQDDLNEFEKKHSGWMRWFTGNKKQFLDIYTLADNADYLRKEYQKAINEYIKFKQSFYFLHKRASPKDCNEEWLKFRSENFSHLISSVLDLIEELRPFELARDHLAYFYGYDEGTMKQKITESRKLRAEKSKKGNF